MASARTARTVQALSSDSAQTALLNLARVSAKESKQSPSGIHAKSDRIPLGWGGECKDLQKVLMADMPMEDLESALSRHPQCDYPSLGCLVLSTDLTRGFIQVFSELNEGTERTWLQLVRSCTLHLLRCLNFKKAKRSEVGPGPIGNPKGKEDKSASWRSNLIQYSNY